MFHSIGIHSLDDEAIGRFREYVAAGSLIDITHALVDKIMSTLNLKKQDHISSEV